MSHSVGCSVGTVLRKVGADRGEPNLIKLLGGKKSMKNNTHGIRRHRARIASASVIAVAVLASGSAALADGGRATFVSGNSTFSDCGIEGSDLALAMTGDLQGCWSVFVEGFSCKELPDFDLYFERGREVFVGTLRGKQGRFRTTYTIEGAYAKGFCQSFDFGQQLAGGCDHKVYGKSGVFREAEGLIEFLDVVAGVTYDQATGAFGPGTGANNFLYYGHINLDD